jgi:hypothetical protein
LIAAELARTSAPATKVDAIKLFITDSGSIRSSYAQQSRPFRAGGQDENRPAAKRTCSCASLPHSPAVPVTVAIVVPAMPTMMAMIAVMSPVHFRCRQFGILLNRRGGAGIAER